MKRKAELRPLQNPTRFPRPACADAAGAVSSDSLISTVLPQWRYISVALFLKSPSAGVTRYPCPVEPGLSSWTAFRPAHAAVCFPRDSYFTGAKKKSQQISKDVRMSLGVCCDHASVKRAPYGARLGFRSLPKPEGQGLQLRRRVEPVLRILHGPQAAGKTLREGCDALFRHKGIPSAPKDIRGERPAGNRVSADVTEVVPIEGLAHGGGNRSLGLQTGLGNLKPGHHIPGQALHVHHRGEEPGVGEIPARTGQEAEISSHTDGKKIDALPVALRVVQNGRELPGTDGRLAEGRGPFSASVLRQVEAQHLTLREGLRQKTEGDVCLAGLCPVDGHCYPL